MVKIVLNPNYEHLREYIASIPEQFENRGSVLATGRNLIKEDIVQGQRLVIKSYRRIYLPNIIRYSFFYPSKAQRAYDYARVLLDNGFNTPEPFAYIEVKKMGLIRQSYFVCAFTTDTSLLQMKEQGLVPPANLMPELARFTYELHTKRIYHVDYNVGNILYAEENGRIKFSLIDNNRMRFGAVSFKSGIRNLVLLGLSVDQITTLAEEYTRLRNVNVYVGLALFFKYKRDEVLRRARKHKIKAFFGRS